MYHILEFTNGQPIILWQSGNNLQKYIISSGRIYNKGILLKDINSRFKVWNMDPVYISYESVDGSTVISHIASDGIGEVFTTKNLSALIEYNNKLLVFYLSPTDDKYELYVTTSDDFKEKKLICEGLDLSENMCAVRNNDFIILFFNEKQLFISSEFKVVTTINMSSSQNSNTINLQNEVSKLKFELHQLEQHHADFVREYDQLSAYTGELQEKLRKTRLNLKE
ncbi:MAG: hypothetical protein ACLRZ9_05190 [Eubacterium sp.]